MFGYMGGRKHGQINIVSTKVVESLDAFPRYIPIPRTGIRQHRLQKTAPRAKLKTSKLIRARRKSCLIVFVLTAALLIFWSTLLGQYSDRMKYRISLSAFVMPASWNFSMFGWLLGSDRTTDCSKTAISATWLSLFQQSGKHWMKVVAPYFLT